eukprot:TRINITY_DN5855_c0_g1_i7.p1 TRINITY_DN5855_c0_g1~~TRINITY_DN5855_c0_g1_i7.p1  ORF type:complete len:517 (+),score=135.20 TRINITY_DN5855_c0_g1_i7:486-2036(+)
MSTPASSSSSSSSSSQTPTTPRSQAPIILKDIDINFLNDIWKLVEEGLAHNVPIITPKCNSFQRRIVFQEAPERYPDMYVESLDDPSNPSNRTLRAMQFHPCTPEEKVAKQAEKDKKAQAELDKSAGFRRVIDLLIATKKPLVGHNMLLDVMHTYSHFVGTMPPTLDLFKEQLCKTFGPIIDTKYLSSKHTSVQGLFPQGTGLSAAFNSVCNPTFFSQTPTIHATGAFSGYTSLGDGAEARFHEAGYDAYTTGVLFLRMAHHIRDSNPSTDSPMKTSPRRKKAKAPLPHGTNVTDAILFPYINRIPIVRSDAVIYTQGEDEVPDRTNIVYVHDFPESVSTTDLIEYYRQFCNSPSSGSTSQTFPVVSWIDNHSAFVTLDVDPTSPGASGEKADVWAQIFAPSARFKAMPFASFAAASRAPRPQAAETPARPVSTTIINFNSPAPDPTPPTTTAATKPKDRRDRDAKDEEDPSHKKRSKFKKRREQETDTKAFMFRPLDEEQHTRKGHEEARSCSIM